MKIPRLFFIVFLASATFCLGQGTLNEGLVAFYELDNRANDTSGNGYHGTFFGNPEFVPGVQNAAVRLDGIDDYLRVDNNFGTSRPLTWSVWLRFIEGYDYVSDGRAIMGIQSPPTRWAPLVHIERSNGALRFGWGSLVETPFADIPREEWIHFACSVSAGGLATIYLNGEPVASSGGMTETELLDYFILGGQQPTLKLTRFDADNVRIYNRALHPEEVAALVDADMVEDGLHRTARAYPVIENGFLVDVVLIDGGLGYEEPPAVVVHSDAGTGAEVSATIENGSVTGFVVSDAGNGYDDDTVVLVASPPEAPTLEILVTEVTVVMHVTIGHQYQLQSSTDAQNWQNEGELFVAESPTYEQAFEVGPVKRFFRIIEVAL